MKPNKPYPDFPLYAHASGKWARKVKGKTLYFGTWDDPQGALLEYQTVLKGSPPKQYGPLTVQRACNLFLDAKHEQLKRGELSSRSFHDYKRTCKKLVEMWGHRPIEALSPLDFSHFKNTLASTCNVVTVGNEVTRVKTLLKWLHDAEITQQINPGKTFRKPPAKIVRKHRRESGKMMFSALELQRILDESGVHLRAMILLGINCGYQNADCERLPLALATEAIETGWLNYPREKTEVDRRCPLWKMTRRALKQSLRRRVHSVSACTFVLPDGTPFSPVNGDVSKRFRAARDHAMIHRGGFSWLRKTFETVAGECGDQVAVNYIMGHVDSSMAEVYRQEMQDSRLMKAAWTVVRWLTESGQRTA